MHLWRLLLVLTSLGSYPCVAQTKVTPPRPERSVLVQALHDPVLPGSLPTYYTPGSEQRAKELQAFVEGERHFYQDQLGSTLDGLAMAVLSPEQWPKAEPNLPYGMPSVYGHPPVILMPTRWEEVRWMPFPKETDADPVLLKTATAHGERWNEVLYRGADGIAAHELGHQIIYAYGINPHVHWFNELLASYAGYAYLREKVPADVAPNEIFWASGLRAPHPHTLLADFENMYEQLAQAFPANYGWYQCALDQRVIGVYGNDGRDFLRKVQKAFPKKEPAMTSDQVLDRLEKMDSGWKVWAKSLETGKVTPSHLVSK